MVVFKGNKRIFETPNVETSVSPDTRTVNIYGVTTYNDILNCIIPIKSMANGVGTASTININNLGTKSLKGYKNGSKSDLPQNWVSINQIYFVYYDGLDFIVLNNNIQADTVASDVYIFSTEDGSSLFDTYYDAVDVGIDKLEIDNIIGGADMEESFMEAVTNNKIMYYMVIAGENIYLYPLTWVSYTTGQFISQSFTIKNEDGIELWFQFVVENGEYDSGNVSYVEPSPWMLPYAVLELDTGATQQEILDAFGDETVEYKLLSLLSENYDIITFKNYRSSNPTVEQSEYIRIINSMRDFEEGVKDEVLLTYADETGQLYNIVIEVDEENYPDSPFISYSREPAAVSVTIEDDLTSDSHDNPPSVHAVNQALGAIDTILTNILGS